MRPIETIKDKVFLNTILNDVTAEIINIFGEKVNQLILFGSYARNESDAESDIDIMILANCTEEELKAFRPLVSDVMAELSMKYEILISLTQVPFDRYYKYLHVLPYYQNIYNEGIEIYGRKTA